MDNRFISVPLVLVLLVQPIGCTVKKTRAVDSSEIDGGQQDRPPR